jgi:hypothetical protein
MFEEIEAANEGREMIVIAQNHPKAMLSFVWDTTAGGDDAPATQDAQSE